MLQNVTELLKGMKPEQKVNIFTIVVSIYLVVQMFIFFYKRDEKREDICNGKIQLLMENHVAEIRAKDEAHRARENFLAEELIRVANDYKENILKDLKKTEIEFKTIKSSVREINRDIKQKEDILDTTLKQYNYDDENITID